MRVSYKYHKFSRTILSTKYVQGLWGRRQGAHAKRKHAATKVHTPAPNAHTKVKSTSRKKTQINMIYLSRQGRAEHDAIQARRTTLLRVLLITRPFFPSSLGHRSSLIGRRRGLHPSSAFPYNLRRGRQERHHKSTPARLYLLRQGPRFSESIEAYGGTLITLCTPYRRRVNRRGLLLLLV